METLWLIHASVRQYNIQAPEVFKCFGDQLLATALLFDAAIAGLSLSARFSNLTYNSISGICLIRMASIIDKHFGAQISQLQSIGSPQPLSCPGHYCSSIIPISGGCLKRIVIHCLIQ